MSSETTAGARPTRQQERRAQTVREIKGLAMEQIRQGGPDALSLTGIVREMSMSPAAVYRYFANRDALLADLVVDAYDELADALEGLDSAEGPEQRLDAVLRGTRGWALQHPNAYRLIFQTSIGSGADFAADRLIPAASRSMAVLVEALAAVGEGAEAPRTHKPGAVADAGAIAASLPDGIAGVFTPWAERSGLAGYPTGVLVLALLTWTRLHGIISLELGGHLAATGIGADTLFELEVGAIRAEAVALPALLAAAVAAAAVPAAD
ncbi:TetR/AcrR family transcriptional regulator [Subtercola sp. Z020]|uniref:TetR/AcrR family transcriptional regulator n=1 Tax=Subtercola sp. Z020 TaxID=2080582 RepID=UPI00130EDAFA|nr:TetR/AcrR family transcriptional regulator [Subtercola sp. Z020]